MLDKIKVDLADNFKEDDDALLQNIIDRVIKDALTISNRTNTKSNIELLSSEIMECVKSIYLQRGSEGSNSLSDSGISVSFNSPMEIMRTNIVKNGKRNLFL